MQIILGVSQNLMAEQCRKCLDWWAKVERGNKYPVPLGGVSQRLVWWSLYWGNNELLERSRGLVQTEYWQIHRVSTYAQNYMNMLGICGGIADGLMKSLRN
jgi:hypothetical protein